MERFTVYDPKGEMFEVTAGRLNDLVVVRGWTFWHPSQKVEVFKDPKERANGDNGTGTARLAGEGS